MKNTNSGRAQTHNNKEAETPEVNPKALALIRRAAEDKDFVLTKAQREMLVEEWAKAEASNLPHPPFHIPLAVSAFNEIKTAWLHRFDFGYPVKTAREFAILNVAIPSFLGLSGGPLTRHTCARLQIEIATFIDKACGGCGRPAYRLLMAYWALVAGTEYTADDFKIAKNRFLSEIVLQIEFALDEITVNA